MDGRFPRRRHRVSVWREREVGEVRVHVWLLWVFLDGCTGRKGLCSTIVQYSTRLYCTYTVRLVVS